MDTYKIKRNLNYIINNLDLLDENYKLYLGETNENKISYIINIYKKYVKEIFKILKDLEKN
jgi:hypothetical protein